LISSEKIMTNELVPNMFTVLMSNTCTATCDHCTVYSSPERRGKLSLDTIIKSIEELFSMGNLQVVVFAGGEPTLSKETLFEAIAFCDAKGISTRVVTNASWATSMHNAKKMVRRLREAGLRELNISADDYHSPFISFDNVKRAWQASKKEGFTSVAIANCYGPKSIVTPEYIREQLGEPEIEARFDDEGIQHKPVNVSEDGTIYMLSNGRIQRIGRARENVDESEFFYPDSQASIDVPCNWAVRACAVAPNGNLVACCGIEAVKYDTLNFGSTKNKSVVELAKNATQDPVLKGITTIGPYKLLHLAKALANDGSIEVRSRYSSMCEVCEHLVGQPAAIETLKKHKNILRIEVDGKASTV
jgi:MoaA/NifB/PqqE/SkfB family radical SAM enzyme